MTLDAPRARSPRRIVLEVAALGALVVLAVALGQRSGADRRAEVDPPGLPNGPEIAEKPGSAPVAIPTEPTAWTAMSRADLVAVGRQVAEITPGFRFDRVEVFSGAGLSSFIAVLVHEQTELEFSLIPPGSFLMGSPETERGRRESERQHRVTLTKPFLIARTECPQAAWERAGGENDSHWKGPRLPIEQVSWDEVAAWCAAAGLRLPSEAEWEFACRAGTTTPFNVGEDITTDQANYDGRFPYRGPSGTTRGQTLDVGSLPENAFGLHDMHGNVWEWCQDVDASYPSGSATDPVSTSGSRYRVSRGGSWGNNARALRSAIRSTPISDCREDMLGFRPAHSVGGE